MSFADNFSNLMETHDIQQKDMAKKINKAPSTVSMYKRGEREPDIETLSILADYFDISVDRLIGRPERVDKRIPIITSKIAAGLPILADGAIDSYIETPPAIKADYASYVKGDSMVYAGIFDGDLAFFKETNMAQSGQIIAARKMDMESEINLKFYVKNNGGYVLRSANPTYPDQLFTQNHAVIGVLSGLWRDGAPSIMDYKQLLALCQTEEWQEVAEAAASHGWNAKQIIHLIDLHGSLNKKI